MKQPYNNVVFNSNADASTVLRELDRLAKMNNFVTYYQFMSMIGCDTFEGTKTYMWTHSDILNAKIIKVQDGYQIHFPKPEMYDYESVLSNLCKAGLSENEISDYLCLSVSLVHAMKNTK